MPYNLVEICQRFGGIYCLRLEGGEGEYNFVFVLNVLGGGGGYIFRLACNGPRGLGFRLEPRVFGKKI